MNIAEILKNKPIGTSLYSPVCGECALREIKKVIHTRNTYGDPLTFYNDGKYCCNGEVLLFPSKEMRDWSKFAWKEGDVLESDDGRKNVIFDGFTDDTYAHFKGKYVFYSSEYLGDEDFLATQDYDICTENSAKSYIQFIEKRLGDKLNMDTLEMEPSKPSHKYEFKPFDKVVVRDDAHSPWQCDFFSHYHKNNEGEGCIMCVGGYYYCNDVLPYNEDTAKLIGTTNDYKED